MASATSRILMEKRSPIDPDFMPIPWIDWPIEGIQGIEIWNYMSEFKGLLWSKPIALFRALFPEWGIRGPYRATLNLWDELLSKGYRLAAMGNSDAHATPYTMGPIKRVIFPYEYLFRCVNTHILTRKSLSGILEEDKNIDLRSTPQWAGHGWDMIYHIQPVDSVLQHAAVPAWLFLVRNCAGLGQQSSTFKHRHPVKFNC